MDWENNFEINPIQKLEKKTVKTKVKLQHVNKKPLARKRIFVLAFSLHFNRAITLMWQKARYISKIFKKRQKSNDTQQIAGK